MFLFAISSPLEERVRGHEALLKEE